MKNVILYSFFLVFTGYAVNGSAQHPNVEHEKEWRSYNGSPSSNKYSSLQQINKSNITDLELVWIYEVPRSDENGTIKCNPLMIEGTLYGTTSGKNLVALNAKTGEEQWYLDFSNEDPEGSQHSSRGMLYWEDGDDRRLFYVFSQYLYAVDANTGELVKSFGHKGRVHYSTGIVDTTSENKVMLTTPGVIYNNLIITGSFVSERLPAAPGDIRAFNAVTGELVWSFNTIPEPGEFGYDTWPKEAYKIIGGANNWAGMSLDKERGIVYVPTGSPTYDFYGGNRHGKNLFANTLLALDAETGERIWHYQIVHHDLWDRDLPSPPNLLTVAHQGEQIDAVAQPTKQGYIYLFNRETGEPLFDINEVPVPQSNLEGEEAWPTQPIPVAPPPFTRQTFTEDQVWASTPGGVSYVKQELSKYKTGHPFIPPDTQGVILQPEFSGGANWGGAAVDESDGTLVVNANDIPGILNVFDREKEMAARQKRGSSLYQLHCASCHGAELQGGHYAPGLTNIANTTTEEQLFDVIRDGKGTMPAMNHIPDNEKDAIVAYLQGQNDAVVEDSSSESKPDFDGPKYSHRGYDVLLSEEGYPGIEPPWATLTAYNLNEGTIKWQVPLGEEEELTGQGFPPTGIDNLGGPVVTASGLVFIGATADQMFRAFDIKNGNLLWEYELPGVGFATPATYQIGGEQYIVIAVSDRDGSDFKGKYMAFKLAVN